MTVAVFRYRNAKALPFVSALREAGATLPPG